MACWMAAVRSNNRGRPRPRFKDFVCVGSDMEILLNRLSALPKKILLDSLRSTGRFAFGVWRLAFGVWRLAFGVRALALARAHAGARARAPPRPPALTCLLA